MSDPTAPLTDPAKLAHELDAIATQIEAVIYDDHYGKGTLLVSQCEADTLREAASALTYLSPQAQTRREVVERSGIYVASRVSRAPLWKGYRSEGQPIISTWIDEAGDGETGDFGELWARIESEIRGAKALIFYAGGEDDFPFKGAYVEIGIALAVGTPVFIVLENVTLRDRTMRPVGSWILDRRVTRCASLPEAFIRAHSPQRSNRGRRRND